MTTGTTPTSLQEYLERFQQNQRYVGHGFETGMVMPCPFCAAPDFLEYRILDVEAALEKGAACKECGRSCCAIFTREPGAVRFEIVQTGGEDPPEWLHPKMRRL